MIDFKKKLNNKNPEKKTNPIEIYDQLDRSSTAGPLRSTQEKVLEDWYLNRFSDQDVIVKLHTGAGKTLIGLLMLQSKLNSGKGPCVFVCPNIYLAEQVERDAKKFGIPVCKIDESRVIPEQFTESQSILVTHAQKTFNGKTKFGLDNSSMEIGAMVLDDSHACIDVIKQSFTVELKRGDHEGLYKKFLQLFRTSVKDQGEGTFLDIEEGDSSAYLPVPYWAWNDKKEDVLRLLSEYKDHEDYKEVFFSWEIIKNDIENFQAFISGDGFEITPIHIPIEKFGFFHNAGQRILMSATTHDDSFFIKGLAFKSLAIQNPLSDESELWSGEKMILIPSLISDYLDRDTVVNTFANENPSRKFGIVALTPSFSKAAQYQSIGGRMAKPREISRIVDDLKSGNYSKTISFANRYDGIDLPDDACRILIIDSKPYFNSLSEKYEESNRKISDFFNLRVAQKIEQALGRSVRGPKDYSAILLIGTDLVRFVKSSKTQQYFSPQTRKQIEIGLDISQSVAEEQGELLEEESPFKPLDSILNQQLNQRDNGWKEWYATNMNSIEVETRSSDLHALLEKERKATSLAFRKDYEGACKILQDIVNKYCASPEEKAWYRQLLANYQFFISKKESITTQTRAYNGNQYLMKPIKGIRYRKIDYIDHNQTTKIKGWIEEHETNEELMLNVNEVVSDFDFGVRADRFEAAVNSIGEMLGFECQRPDKQFKKGPDNLWCGGDNEYFVFECKSEVEDHRVEIHKRESGQMNNHCGWFEQEYSSEAKVTYFMLIPTNLLADNGNFNFDVKIMKPNKVYMLRKNIKSFFQEFKDYNLATLTDQMIQENLVLHKLDVASLKSEYHYDYVKRKGAKN